jgi:molecular chaperone GrpE
MSTPDDHDQPDEQAAERPIGVEEQKTIESQEEAGEQTEKTDKPSRNKGQDDPETLKRELARWRNESGTSLEKIRYLLADYDNYRKNAEKETDVIIERSRVDILSKIIPIEDDLSRTIGRLKDGNYPTVIIDGLSGILKNLDSLLKSEGVREIEALETPFDPRLHKIAGRVQTIYHTENTVVDVVRKGFMLDNEVLRPSSVILSSQKVSRDLLQEDVITEDNINDN